MNIEKLNEQLRKILNEMSIERSDLVKKCNSMSDIYAEHIQKIIYFGDISESWRQSVWKSVCYIPKRVFSDSKKLPDINFIMEEFIYDAFGIDYKDKPLEAIQRKMQQGVKDTQINGKYGLSQPREVQYPTAAENVKKFNEELVKMLASPPIDKEDVDVLITQYLAVEQVPWN